MTVKKESLKKVQEELRDTNDKYLRALADYQNLEKRIEQTITDAHIRTKSHVVLQFLEVLDDLEKAEIFVKDEGLKMIKDKLIRIFVELGVKEMDLFGTEYDPHLAEAVEIVPGADDNIISEIVRKGYLIGDKVLRPAQVKVSKKSN